MRILHLVDRLPGRGGAYTHLAGIVAALHERGHETLVVGGDQEEGLEARGRQAVDLEAAVRRFRPDVVHLHTIVNPAVLEWAAGHPAMITIQDHRYFCPARGKWTADGRVCRDGYSPDVCRGCFDDEAYFRGIFALTQERLAAVRRLTVVALSHYMRMELVAAGVPESAVSVVPPFVHDLDLAAPPDGPPCVLFVGRLAESKGIDEAIEAWRRSGVDLPLIVAGTGPRRGAVEAQGVTVLGWVSRERLALLYARARALLMPSRWQEPFGIAGLEARAFGVPVVAWESGGVSEWYDGEGLVPWGDLDGLARELRRAVQRRSTPAAGFDRDALMDRLLAVYERCRRPTATAGTRGASAGSPS